jgi:hypothetical protein
MRYSITIKSFLGMAGWFSSFIQSYSELSSPLSDMTKNGKPNNLVWEEKGLCCFNKLKSALSHKPVLRLSVAHCYRSMTGNCSLFRTLVGNY